MLHNMAYRKPQDEPEQVTRVRLPKGEETFGIVEQRCGGSRMQVRCFDGKTGRQIAEIKLPVQKVTSCCFAGEKLDQLIITTAVGNPGEEMDLTQYPQAGYIFIATPGVTGKKTNLFGA